METNDKDNQEVPKTIPDKETQEILEEMNKDGIKDVIQPTPPETVENKDKKPEEIKTEPAKVVEPVKKEDDSDNLEEKNNTGMMPVKKHTDKINKLKADHEKEMENLRRELQNASQTGVKDVPKKLEALAEKYSADPEFVKELFDVIKTDSPITPEVKRNLDYINKKAEQENQNEQFNSDFDNNVSSLIKEEYPDATQSQIDGIKQKVREYAFDEKYKNTPLDLIYNGLKEFRNFLEDSTSKKPAESSGKRTKATGILDFENMTDTEAAKLSDEDFDKFSEYKANKGSHLSIRRKN